MKKGALLILTNATGEVLLQHKDAKAPLHANKWCLFGGGIEKDEDPSTAIRREFTEELEWHIQKFVHFKSYSDHEVFVAHTNRSADELRAKLHEGNDLGFFAQSDLQTLNIAAPHLKFLQDYFDQKSS